MFFLDPVDSLLAFVVIPVIIGVLFSLFFASIETLLRNQSWIKSFARTLLTLILFYLFLILCIIVIDGLNWYV